MGWTSKRYTDATHHSFDENNAAEFIKDEIIQGQLEIYKAHLNKSPFFNDYKEIYISCKNTRTQSIFIIVILIEIINEEIFWKEITESMGPSACNCPAELFKFVPAPNEYAEHWRKDCIKKNIKFNPLNLD